MIRVVCGCGRVFQAEDRHVGKRTRCPVCGASLMIGDTPTSSLSGDDVDEVPSWWYPSDPPGEAGSEAKPARGGGDRDGLRTAVFPISPDPALMSGSGNHPQLPMSAKGAPAQGPGRPFSRVRRLWALAVGTTALAVLALAAVLWMRSVPRPGGDATEAQGVRPSGRPRSGPENRHEPQLRTPCGPGPRSTGASAREPQPARLAGSACSCPPIFIPGATAASSGNG